MADPESKTGDGILLSSTGENKAISSTTPNGDISTEMTQEKVEAVPSELRLNLFMVFITLTQLVQMIPLGAGINSSLAIGEALGATRVQSVWIVASYPLAQGSFVLIGNFVSSRKYT
jgi:hypothetical protein